LASEYVDFYKAFTMASRGIIELEIEEHNLITAKRIATETQYEAYNRLVKPIGAGFADTGLMSNFEEIQSRISSTLRVKDQRYSFTTTPELIAFTIATLQPLLEQRFILPDSWRFSRYSISDFRQAFSVISALANLQYAARFLAVQSGDFSVGIASSLLVMSRATLIPKILRYSNLGGKVAKAIIEDMSLGARGISLTEADPTLQPLIQLNEEQYAIVPQLWINSAAERNFVALINRLPKDRDIYLRLVQDKEAVMRERIEQALNRPAWRYKSGRVLSGKLPDIDLAIIDPANRCCLLLELKWFLDPAEPRELIEKSEEIRKGIAQLSRLRKALQQKDALLLNRLEIESDYSIGYVVVSENWIGYSNAQDPEIPVVREHHLIKKLESSENLADTLDWLSQRKYLPKEGVHYRPVENISQVGSWRLKWYGLESLVKEDEFLPL